MQVGRVIRIGALAFLPVAAAWLLGVLATFPNLAPWYAGLVKPAFNPPNWIFGPVWSTLYVLMAIAAFRVLSSPARDEEKTFAMAVFYGQLFLNAAWSWLFFAAHSPLLGLIDIVPQWLLVVWCAILFWRIDRLAGLLLVPLVAWVGFASVLNAAIWRLN